MTVGFAYGLHHLFAAPPVWLLKYFAFPILMGWLSSQEQDAGLISTSSF